MVMGLWCASYHLTLSEKQVPNASPYGSTEGIVVRNGNTLPISSVGFGFLYANDNSSLIVNHLLHIPCVVTYLFLVQKLCTDINVFVEFQFGSFFY